MHDSLIIRSCKDAKEWDTFVSCIPWAAPQHAFAWGHALENCFGYLRQMYKLFLLKDHVVAALPIIRLSAGWPFHSLHSLVFDSYGGPLIHPAYFRNENLLDFISAAIDSEAAQCNAFEVKMIAPPSTPEAVVQCLGSNDTSMFLQRECHILSLRRSFETIAEGYAPSVRRAIKHSVREGVVVQENPDLKEVRAAYPIYRDTMKQLGGTAKPWRFIETLLQDGLAVPFLARRNRITIGVVVLLVSSRAATYWISAANPSTLQYRPTNALVNHAIKWCCNHGIELFSFGETRENRPGLVRFKRGWGTETQYSTTVIRVYRPHIRQMWTAIEPTARHCYAVWDRFRYGAS
jgi:Acetyltransferase (GNAT) domain